MHGEVRQQIVRQHDIQPIVLGLREPGHPALFALVGIPVVLPTVLPPRRVSFVPTSSDTLDAAFACQARNKVPNSLLGEIRNILRQASPQ